MTDPNDKARQEKQEARTVSAGFSMPVVMRESQYAENGNRLPMFHIEQRLTWYVVPSSWLTSHCTL
jgi:hypothetical protein